MHLNISKQSHVTLSYTRSHGKILDIPSRLFYSGALRQCVDVSTFRNYYRWDRLARPVWKDSDAVQEDVEVFPMLFVGELPCMLHAV